MIIGYIRKHHTSVIFTLVWIYLVGIVGLSLDFSREVFKTAVPFTLLLSLLLLAVFHEKYSPKFILLALIIFLAGFFIEVAGVATGVVFGGYAYGTTLGPAIWGTPLMIGVNWLMLTYCIWLLVSRLKWNRMGQALLGSALLVIYDLFMEPVAIWLDMWSWEGVRVPLQNYIAWFVISFVLLLLISFFHPRYNNKVAPALFVTQLLFFVTLNMVKILIN